MGFFSFLRRKLKPTPVPTPAFEDRFNQGYLRPEWIVSNWGAPMGGKFLPDYVDVKTGCLRLKLTQRRLLDQSIQSIGGEIQLNRTFGYGTYEFEMRASSTSATPDGPGAAQSGSCSGLFNYVNESETEIDFEFEGQNPTTCWMTNYKNLTLKESTSVNVLAASQVFRTYKFVWKAGSVQFYVDNNLAVTHVRDIPTTAAYPIINHWGTNTPNWGGLATVGSERYLFVRRFAFTPL